MLPMIALLWITGAASEFAAAQSTLPTASILVEDADGMPVEGALACIGTVIDVSRYGASVTNASGTALFNTPLPEGPATIYFTAGKDGHGAQAVQSYAAPAAPYILKVRIRLPASPGGTVCAPGGSGTSLERIDASPELQRSNPTTPQP